MKKILLSLIIIAVTAPFSISQNIEKTDYAVFPFGEMGQIKTTYDARQRPNCVYIDGKVYLAFNAGASAGSTDKSKTKPMVVTFDVATEKFSDIVTLGS